MRWLLCLLLVVGGWLAGDVGSAQTVAAPETRASTPAGMLFDATAGTLPTAQGWVYLTNPLLNCTATTCITPGALVLDTTPADKGSAGYFCSGHPQMPRLDAAVGYRVRIDLRIVREEHLKPQRAGFSLLVLGHDHRGIELAFWEQEIFAQSGPDFQRSESARFDTTARRTAYLLSVAGDKYALSADGKQLLSGALRNYFDHGHPVYRLANIVFIGDDTSSAAAQVEVGTIAVDGGVPNGTH